MRLIVWTKDENITDDTFKDGDIWQVYPDSWIPGAMETKRWLVVQIDDYVGSQEELVAPEYSVGPGNEAIIRRMRKYRLDYAPRLTPDELIAVKDSQADVPVVVGRFVTRDIVRK